MSCPVTLTLSDPVAANGGDELHLDVAVCSAEDAVGRLLQSEAGGGRGGLQQRTRHHLKTAGQRLTRQTQTYTRHHLKTAPPGQTC